MRYACRFFFRSLSLSLRLSSSLSLVFSQSPTWAGCNRWSTIKGQNRSQWITKAQAKSSNTRAYSLKMRVCCRKDLAMINYLEFHINRGKKAIIPYYILGTNQNIIRISIHIYFSLYLVMFIRYCFMCTWFLLGESVSLFVRVLGCVCMACVKAKSKEQSQWLIRHKSPTHTSSCI